MYARIYEWLEKSRTTDIRLDAGRSERMRRGMISSVAGSGIGGMI